MEDMENIERRLKELLEPRVEEMEKIKQSFQSIIQAISDLLRKYSVEDVAESLFVSNMWLPNIASPVKHQLLTAIFAAIKPEEFSAEDKIKTYGDFIAFLEQVYKLVPSFPSLEDFIPEPDWGDVKFHHEGRNYKMFYGNELSNVHEYLMLFQMLYEPYKRGYIEHAGRSPAYELQSCLGLQEAIIEGITAQPERESLQISRGGLEIPPEEFWKNAQSFYSGFKPEEIVSKALAETYSINLGEYPKESLEYDSFGEKVFTGTLVPAFFVKHESRYFPILPRRYSSILFDKWAEVFQQHSKKVEPSEGMYTLRLGARIHEYIDKRLRTDNIFRSASPLTEEGKSHETLFPTVFISGNTLVMIYLIEPTTSSEKMEEELARVAPKLNKALELASSQPTKLALHLDKQHIQLCSESGKDVLKPEIITLIPQVSTQIGSFLIPEDLPGRVMFVDSFLGIIDELDHDSTFAAFFDYLDELGERAHPAISALDRFAAFKHSHGVLIEGALDFDLIMLDPHGGTNMRYQSLAEFWKIYPEVDFFDHPRIWKVTQETATRVRLEARGYFGSAIYSRIGPTNFYFTAPFREMEYEQGNLSNLLMECLEDSMSRRESIIKGHAFFRYLDRVQVNFFPLSLVLSDDSFKHLRHLCKIEKNWCSDFGKPDFDTYGIRIVFDDEAIKRILMDAQDCSLEADILIEVVRQLDKIVPDPKVEEIIAQLEKTKSGKPRFKLLMLEKQACFPEFISPLEPEATHFKKARKRIAELARQLSIEEGDYELEEAKGILNKLRDAVVAEINAEVAKHNLADAIPFLLARTDALTARYERQRLTIEHGLEHETDYQPEVKYAEKHTEFLKAHKNYRYLIEKFVQLQPAGKEALRREKFQYLIALIDWLHVLYSASDSLHYGILPVGIKLKTDYLIEVLYEDDMQSKEKIFSEQMKQLELGLIGNPKDRVDSPRPIIDFLEELDKAATKDLGFSFKKMISLLHVLSFWPSSMEGAKESTSYSATSEEIEHACLKDIEGISREEIKLMIDFLCLKKEDVLRILGQSEPCVDLPLWEHTKRYARYTIRPLIRIGDRYHWGPHSARRSGIVWSGTPLSGTMPTDMQAPSIDGLLRTEKKLIEDALADKALGVVERYTPHAKKNLKLHKLEPKGSHPQDLGDYDVLSFHADKNVVLNIECKDILPPYCFKDAKRLRDKIFGRPGKNQGHFEQINKRRDYVSDHILDIARALEWPVEPDNPPKIVTIYLSRHLYWWTKFPPEEIEAVFLRIDLLSDFVGNLGDNSSISSP